MKKILKFALLVFLIIILFCASSILYLEISTRNIKFNGNNLTKNFNTITLYDLNNKKIEINDQINFTTDIPLHVKSAFIALEDKRFYSHNGIDYKRTFKSFLVNLKNGKISQGGSTISQQLIKNTHLNADKTIKRKYCEIKLTKKLEKDYSKDQILNYYLNNIYFGENCYGIFNASKRYFNKEPKELSIEEGAMLAGIVKAPSKYNPIVNINMALKRKNLTLLQMLKNGFIQENQYKNLINKEINIKEGQDTTKNHLYEEILNELTQIFNSPYINKNISVSTYIDLELQNNIQKISTDEKCDKSYIVIDNKTLGINAYYSSCNSALRQPASTIKPLLVYGPCYQENIVTPQTKILDKKTNFDGYSPSNFNEKYYGFISCKDALSKSLNIPSVKLLNNLGIDKCKEYGKKLNIELSDENLSIALGGLKKGMTLKHLTSCYTTFANNGNYSIAKFIKEIKNEKGKTIYKNKTNNTKVFTEETAYLINYNLMDSVKNGTSKKLSCLNYQICAKTGTNGNKKGNLDAYSIAYTTDKTIGVWLGARKNNYLSNNCTGSNHSTIISKQILTELYKEYKPSDFKIPNNVVKVKYDKETYDKEHKFAKVTNDYYEGVFIKGTEPIFENNENIPFIKNIIIKDDIMDFLLFYESDNVDGILVYKLKNNNELLIKDTNSNPITIKKENGQYKFKLVPYSYLNNKKIFGEPYYTPTITINNNKNTNDWWIE